ncbi:MAG: hypothetical protein PHC62_00115 [Candidatus Izemoplasmatales bacterium]|nr:hypothetical protein [Candidatus Izemoplasmatales bacterium]
MYQPIRYLKANECPICGTPTLNLVDIDIAIYAVDGTGKMGDHVEGLQFFLQCSKCKKKYETEKKGQYVRIKTSIENVQLHIEANPFYGI